MAREDKIKDFEEELKKTKYNKRTQHHIGLVKAKIAKLKEEIIQKGKGKGKSDGYVLRKSGDATVVLVGFPSVGKSTLLNQLTNAESKVAAYEFTTLTVVPGLMEHNMAKIQIFDVPGIVEGAADGTGRGREVLAAIRTADMLAVMLDINQLHHHDILMEELYEADFRVNKKRPDVRIKKKSKGGISISSTVPLEVKKETLIAILKEFKYNNADVLIRTKIDTDELIDVITGDKKYIYAMLIINKIDSVSKEKLEEVKKRFPEAVYVSAGEGTNLEELKQKIYDNLHMIRIYLKEPGKEADMTEPLILREGDTLQRLCEKLHKDFVKKFKFCRAWGKSARYDGQKLTNMQHIVKDEDIIELHIK
ncbi:GTP-binding protein [archaeon]|jgi:uncharacterized protein|nr:GTP-binding protein [archaeon]MBT4022350.1 GTP-binding protein [archaeon]MBT4273228.1 GTP-binding protein [archaeon]MBT4461329.1 GTP-binding protein [archaeon]MBT4858992.1 GTP-binding protein [archaeon]